MATITKLLTAEGFAGLPSSRWAELINRVVFEMMPPGVLGISDTLDEADVVTGFSCSVAEIFE